MNYKSILKLENLKKTQTPTLHEIELPDEIPGKKIH